MHHLIFLTCHFASHSSEESAKAKTQKEVIKTLKELKLHLPAEKRHSSKSSTLSTLKYALCCVKQVEGNVFSFQSAPFRASLPLLMRRLCGSQQSGRISWSCSRFLPVARRRSLANVAWSCQ